MEEITAFIDNLSIFVEDSLFKKEPYIKQLDSIRKKESKVIYINFDDLPDEYKIDLRADFYGAVRDGIKEQLPSDDIFISFKSVPLTKKLREMDSTDISKLNTINGVVINSAPPKSIVRRAYFRCSKCNEMTYVDQVSQVLEKPAFCPSCNATLFIMEEKESKWDDYQELTIQENPDEAEIGAVPRTLKVMLVGQHLVNKCKPGDMINLTGILSVEPIGRGTTRVYNWFIIGNYVDILTKDAFSAEISPEDITVLEEWSKHPKIKEILINSIFPSIYGWEEEKYGLTLCLFGGVEHKGTDINFRGSSNCLLIGDPSTAKTAMIIASSKVAPKAIYTQAGGSTGVGLTASAVKDGDSWTLAAGAVVLANGGMCAIDEIEKMTKEDRDKLHEAMEVQTVSINKANIHATLNAKTTILAAGNPKYGKYDEKYTVADNVDLPPTILSRFDLIYIMRDVPDEKKDEGIMNKIFDSLDDSFKEDLPLIPTDIIKKYILYAKSKKPFPNVEARRRLMAFYLTLRGSQKGSKVIPIAPRQFQGMIRLTQASARMALRDEATIDDAELAIQLILNTLARANIDPSTGQFDTNLTEQGKPMSKSNKERTFKECYPTGIYTRDDAYSIMLETMPSLTKAEFDSMFNRVMNRDKWIWIKDVNAQTFESLGSELRHG